MALQRGNEGLSGSHERWAGRLGIALLFLLYF